MPAKPQALSCLLVLLAVSPALAGPTSPDDPKHENHFAKLDPVETDAVKIEFSGTHAQQEFLVTKTRVQNLTDDYILIREHEPRFVLEHGEFPIGKGKEKKPVIIKPRGKTNRSWKASGDDRFHVDSFSLSMAGFFRVAEKGNAQPGPDFQLPASLNDFSAGPFDCSLTGVSQETKVTEAAFACTYKGSALGFIDPARAGVRIENGREFANEARNAKKKMLAPGDKAKFTLAFKISPRVVDMQFAVLKVVWRDTFTESTPTPLDLAPVSFELDQALTLEQND